jgi:signal transduction histidine kinase/CheY-like chemotaxis protein/HAMP domain-containing protein
MNFPAPEPQAKLQDVARLAYRGGLFRKYVTLFVIIVCVALIVNGIAGIWLFYHEQKQSLIRLQRQQVELAAVKISQFIKEIESQLRWTIQLPWSADMLDELRYDAMRLFRQVPAITELSQLDSTGREQLRLSRTTMDTVHSQKDFSGDPRFIEALAHKVYYGPVYFRSESEPFMILAMAGARRDGGVTVAEINLKLIWDIVSQIDVGEHGQAYVIDERGRLIAHRDISLVLRRTDFSQLAQVKQARGGTNASVLQAADGENIRGQPVLAAYAPVAPLGWLVFVELPKSEAYAPLNRSILLSIVLLVAGFLVATMSGLQLARRMIDPIRKLQTGAVRIGGGDLSHRISIKTNDELEALGEQFNSMAIQLEQSYATLEGKVIERTHELALANAELADTNQALREEVSRRADTEREASEQHTATSEALRVIASSPGELQPVFQAMLERAVRMCEAKAGVLFLHENGMFNAAATLGLVPAFSEFLSKRGPFRPEPNSTNGHLLRTRQVSHWDAGAVTCATVDLSGARTTLGVPMLKDDLLIGSIVIFRQEVRPFADKQIALVQHFAAQAVIAIESTRLLSELRARTSELTRSVDELRALGEVSQAVNSTLDLQTVLVTIIATAMQISATEAGAIYVFDETKKEFELSATFGMSADMIAAMRDMRAEVSAAVGSRAATHEASQIPDLREARVTPLNDVVLRAGYRALLLVPLLRSDRVVGALVVRRRAPGEFARSTIDLLKTFAAQSVLAIQNARLFAEIDNKGRQLQLANTAKSRFLAMASHDLRQPLHALGLFVAQLRTPLKPGERAKTVGRVDAAVSEMTEMFNSLLDISKLDAGVLTPRIVDFPMARLLQKIETTFDQAAREKGLRLRIMRSDAWVRSDALLLERILFNLVSNAVRYTLRGGIIVGCRRRGETLRIEVWDSGPGISEDQKQNIFGEFVQLPAPEQDRHGSLGLGLAIVDRLRRLLNHEIELTSALGRGSRFTLLVPLAAEGAASVETVRPSHPAAFAVEGKVILVIDDAPIVLEGTSGLLGKWGYSVVTALSDEAALTQLTERKRRPDLIISDYHLANGKTGIEAIERIGAAFGASIPAVLISGDTAPERLRDARDKGYILLHKPVDPMRLRAVMHQLFKDHDDRRGTVRASK